VLSDSSRPIRLVTLACPQRPSDIEPVAPAAGFWAWDGHMRVAPRSSKRNGQKLPEMGTLARFSAHAPCRHPLPDAIEQILGQDRLMPPDIRALVILPPI